MSSSLKQLIEKGKLGKNIGYSMGLPKLESVIDGIVKQIYTVIAGSTGTGKSSLALYAYVFRPLIDNMNILIIYFSLELSKEMIEGKLLSLYLWEKFNVELSVRDILGKTNRKPTAEEYKLIDEGLQWISSLSDRLVIYDMSLNSKKYYHLLLTELDKQGKSYTDDKGIKRFVMNDTDKVVLAIVDHMSLIRPEEGRTKKQEMDLLSQYAVTIRNRCGVSPVMVMQTNRDATSMDRRKGGTYQTPQLSDSKDSGGPIEDSEIALFLFDPFREKLQTYKGYNISNGLKRNAKSLFVLKNRYGEADVEVPLNFFGRIGLFRELPKPEEITSYDEITELIPKEKEVRKITF